MKPILGIRNQKSLQQAHVPSFNTQGKVKRQLFMSTKNKEKRYNTADLTSEKHRISKESKKEKYRRNTKDIIRLDLVSKVRNLKISGPRVFWKLVKNHI